MRIHQIVWSAAAFSGLALADVPFTTPSLGTVDATIDFCARIDPAAAVRYQEQARLMVRGVSEQEVESVRNTSEYHVAYAQASAALLDVHHQGKADMVCNGKPAWVFKKPAPIPGGQLSRNERGHDEPNH